jgi:MFS family permease
MPKRLDRTAVVYKRLVLFVTLALVVMGNNVLTPLMTVYATRFGISSLVVALSFAAYVATLLPTLLFFGTLSDRLGRRRVLQFALGTMGLGAIVLATASSAPSLVLGRAIQGIGVGIGSAAGTAALVDVSKSPARAGATAALAMLGGAALATIASGLISQNFTWPTTTPFIAYVASLIPAALSLNSIPETAPSAPAETSLWRLPRFGLDPSALGRFVTAVGVGGCTNGTNTVVVTLLPLILVAVTGVNDKEATGTLIAVYLAIGGLAQVVWRRRDSAGKCLVGLLGLSVGILTAALAQGHVIIIEAGIVVAGAGSGLAYGGSLAYCAEDLPITRRAEVLSTFYALMYVSSTISVVAAGASADHLGLRDAFVAFSWVLVVLCAAAAMLVWRTAKSRTLGDT